MSLIVVFKVVGGFGVILLLLAEVLDDEEVVVAFAAGLLFLEPNKLKFAEDKWTSSRTKRVLLKIFFENIKF